MSPGGAPSTPLVASRAVACLLGILLAGACAEVTPPPDPEPEPQVAPVAVNEIAVLRARSGRVIAGTSAGLVILDEATLRFTLSAGEGDLSHAGVTALDVAADGTIWTGHAAVALAGGDDPASEGASPEAGEAPAAPPVRRGGVRAFAPDGSVRAYFRAEGLPGDDVLALAVTGRAVAVATAEGLAVLREGAEAFEPALVEPRRRVIVVDPGAGGATRAVTEFRPRGERVLALAAAGDRLWVGTNHGLLLLDGDTWRRVVLPSCRRDGRLASSILALGVRPDGVAAVLGLESETGFEPSGVAEVLREGTGATCHVPGVDVPAALTPGIASDGRTTWIATYEGLVALKGSDAHLLERGVDLPRVPPMAVAPDGAGGVWVGTWGAGICRVSAAGVVSRIRLESGSSGTASVGPSRAALSPEHGQLSGHDRRR